MASSQLDGCNLECQVAHGVFLLASNVHLQLKDDACHISVALPDFQRYTCMGGHLNAREDFGDLVTVLVHLLVDLQQTSAAPLNTDPATAHSTLNPKPKSLPQTL